MLSTRQARTILEVPESLQADNLMRSISLPLPRQFRTDEGGKLEITVVIGENPLSLSLSLSLQLLSAECH